MSYEALRFRSGLEWLMRLSLFAYFLVAPWSELLRIGGMRSSRLLGILILITAGLVLLARRQIMFTDFHRRLGLYYIWMFFTIMWSFDMGLGMLAFSVMLKGLMLIIATWQVSADPRHYDQYLDLFIGGFIISMMLTLPGPIASIFNVITPGVMRFSGTLSNPNLYSQILAVMLPLAICRLKAVDDLPRRVLCGVFLLLAIYSIVRSGSRGGLICMLFALGAMFYFERSVSLRSLTLGAVIALGLLLASGVISVPDDILERLGSAIEEITVGTMSSRKDIWAAGFEVFALHPIAGVGPGNFNISILGIYGEAKAAHNTYLDVLVEHGMIGFGLFLVAFAALYRRVKHLADHGNPGPWVAFITLGLSAMTSGHGPSQLTYCLLVMLHGYCWVPDRQPRTATLTEAPARA